MNDTYFDSNKLKIINGDSSDTSLIAENSIDLIVTSPPYNVDIAYNSHKDGLSYDLYLEFSNLWLKNCYQWLKDDGRLCLNVPLDKNKGGQQSVGADFTKLAKSIGYKYHSTVIWNEGNISRRTAWGSWLSASAPYVIAPVELIIILYKNQWRKLHSGLSNITKEEFIEWTNGIWTFSGESKKKIGHPTPFPIELPRRCIKLFSYVEDTILDPFMGSGTTLIAAQINNRHSVGIEIDRKYCEIAKSRLLNETDLNKSETFRGVIMNKSQSELVMDYFENHPKQDLNHGPVVDWVTTEWLKNHEEPPRDPWRATRKLHQEGKLIKVKKGVYRYDPDYVHEVDLYFFDEETKKKIFEKDNYKCVLCGRGRESGIDLVVDHKIPKDKGGSNDISNGQTLCTEHNLLKKNYSQTETGKKFFIKVYEKALESNDEKMVEFCKKIFDVYDEHKINGHIKRPNGNY